LLDLLGKNFGEEVSSEDLLAYVAAVTSHSGFTRRFHEDLRTPGIRVPITANKELWDSATNLGRRVLWLHTRGERYVDSSKGCPRGTVLQENPNHRPKVVQAIPNIPGRYPDELTYDDDTETLSIGEGKIAPVPQAVVDYEVNGMNVLRKWFGYRRATRPQARGD
jgi:predicted helicase